MAAVTLTDGRRAYEISVDICFSRFGKEVLLTDVEVEGAAKQYALLPENKESSCSRTAKIVGVIVLTIFTGGIFGLVFGVLWCVSPKIRESFQGRQLQVVDKVAYQGKLHEELQKANPSGNEPKPLKSKQQQEIEAAAAAIRLGFRTVNDRHRLEAAKGGDLTQLRNEELDNLELMRMIANEGQFDAVQNFLIDQWVNQGHAHCLSDLGITNPSLLVRAIETYIDAHFPKDPLEEPSVDQLLEIQLLIAPLFANKVGVNGLAKALENREYSQKAVEQVLGSFKGSSVLNNEDLVLNWVEAFGVHVLEHVPAEILQGINVLGFRIVHARLGTQDPERQTNIVNAILRKARCEEITMAHWQMIKRPGASKLKDPDASDTENPETPTPPPRD